MTVDPPRMLATLALLAALLPPTEAPPPRAGSETVVGRVVESRKGKPVGYANVIAIGTRRGAMTDEKGRFRIERAPLGECLLRVQASGYTTSLLPIVVAKGTNDVGVLVLTRQEDETAVQLVERPIPGASHLVADIRMPTRSFRVGDPVTFETRIRNRGDTAVILVRGRECSDAWLRPEVRIEIEGPDSGFVADPIVSGEERGSVEVSDFERVLPGQEFDPWKRGAGFAQGDVVRVVRPGRYRATFFYDTSGSEQRRWFGGLCVECRLPDDVRELVSRVPSATLRATTEFEVLP